MNHALKEQLTGKLEAAEHPWLAPVEVPLADVPLQYMHTEALQSYLQMHQAAASQGISMQVVSSYRSFAHQCRLWNSKWNNEAYAYDAQGTLLDERSKALNIMRYSAMPGTSRHHWGTDIDLNSVEPAYFASGEGLALYHWLKNNAAAFGFYQPYSARSSGRLLGYEEEPWHWSYLPIARGLTRLYASTISAEHIRGFDGDHLLDAIPWLEAYVLGLDAACL